MVRFFLVLLAGSVSAKAPLPTLLRLSAVACDLAGRSGVEEDEGDNLDYVKVWFLTLNNLLHLETRLMIHFC